MARRQDFLRCGERLRLHPPAVGHHHAVLCICKWVCKLQGILEEVRLISWPNPLQVCPAHSGHAHMLGNFSCSNYMLLCWYLMIHSRYMLKRFKRLHAGALRHVCGHSNRGRHSSHPVLCELCLGRHFATDLLDVMSEA